MLTQASAFVTRSIRQESRLLHHHLLRGVMLLMMLYLLGTRVLISSRTGASGFDLISSVASCCYWCLTLLSLTYFSVSITEEKEEETLPLLQMTGVRPWALLLGKSLPRLAVVVLLLLISAPFLILAVTLGGVLTPQIFALLAALVCYAFCLSQAGLLASTVSRTSYGAVSLMTVLWLLLEFGYVLVRIFGYSFSSRQFSGPANWLEFAAGWLEQRTVRHAIHDHLMFERGDRIFHPQLIFSVVSGVVFYILSLLGFEKFSRHAIAEGAVAAVTRRLPGCGKTRTGRMIRSWDAGLEWKSWQFTGGGVRWFTGLLIGLPVVSVLSIVGIQFAVGDTASPAMYAGTMMNVGIFGLLLYSGRTLGMILNREVLEKTLASLFLLPVRNGEIIRRLLMGVLPFLIPFAACALLGLLWLAVLEPYMLEGTVRVMVEPWVWATLSWVVVALHLGTYLSLHLRYGAMLIAMVICFFLLPFVMGIFLSILGLLMVFGFGEIALRFLFPTALIVANLVICRVLQLRSLRRMEEIVAR